MYPFPEITASATSLFSAYAQFAALMMLFRSMAKELMPHWLQSYIQSLIGYLFTPLSNKITIVIDEQVGMTRNQVYDSAEIYLSKKISPTTERFKVNKTPKQKSINISMEKDQEITDIFKENIELKWKFIFQEARYEQGRTPEKRYFELTFNISFKDMVLNDYLPFIMEKATEIKANNRVVKLYTRDCPDFDDDCDSSGNGIWGSVGLDHPATFDTLALDPKLKTDIINDLDRFLKRKEYYKKVGKAWKRGYLLYGPPGTGKSSLIAAMANYLKFDIYDLELTSLHSNFELRRILISTNNRSIIVIEDIDCSIQMHDRQQFSGDSSNNNKLTLSGLLNFIDGLWSSCGDERIIVFTTNYKEKIDLALLRPGRMDMHIHLSYCTAQGFKTLASNYLEIDDVEDHIRFAEIESMFDKVEVTPAEVAEQLMRSEDTELAMEGVVDFLKTKREDIKKEENCPSQDVEENGTMGLELSSSPDEEIEMPRKIRTTGRIWRGRGGGIRRRGYKL